MKDISRRDFLKYVGAGGLGVVARPKLLSALDNGLLPPDDASDVVQCFHEAATSGATINEPVVQIMVDESIKALTGIPDVGEAWKSVFPGITDTSIVGIKVNCVNRYCPTNPELVNCIASGLARMDVGGSPFKRNNIITWDRSNSELTSSGFTKYTGSDPDTVRCFGTNESGVGYDTGVTFVVASSANQNPSKILSQMCDYLIDAAVLKDHSQGAVTLTLKNHYGSIHNAGGLQHSSGCSPAIPSLNQQIRDVVVPNNIQKLFITDGLFGIYSGGPGGQPDFNPKLILMSKDPVACDTQGQNVINAERVRQGLSPLNAAHLTTAAQPPYSLGTTEVNLIELNNVGVGEGGRLVRGDGIFTVAPEPVRDRATVTFSVGRSGPVSLELLNPAGRTEARLFAGTVNKGKHRVEWRPGRTPTGTHFLRLNCGGAVRVRKVVVASGA